MNRCWRRIWRGGHAAHSAASGGCLAQLPDDAAATIEHNPDVKSREMGLFPGAVVRMLRNRAGERALVIAVGDARLLLARRIAQRIRLQ